MVTTYANLSSDESIVHIPPTQYAELKARTAELDSTLGEVMETIISLMLRDNYSQLKSAICHKHENRLSARDIALKEAYDYLGSLPETLEDAQFYFEAGRER